MQWSVHDVIKISFTTEDSNFSRKNTGRPLQIYYSSVASFISIDWTIDLQQKII